MDEIVPLELADVFRAGFDRYRAQAALLPQEHYAVAHSIMACHTAILGGHVYRCDKCGHDLITYNSCRNRHCPSCQAFARVKWVHDRIEELLPVPCFHVVFTIPSELNPFALRNKECFYSLLFRAVNETLKRVAADPRHLGARQGYIAVLHTWGQNLIDHPHVHCVVPGGGLDEKTGTWKAVPHRDFLFPVKVLSAMFRGLFLSYFRESVDNGNILFHGSLGSFQNDPSAFNTMMNRLYAADWVVYSKAPFAGPEAVIKYLGNYTHRIAFSNKRLVSLTTTEVSFRWKDYAHGDEEKVMTLPIEEFIRRFLLHVFPSGFVRIRYYGFMCPGQRKKLDLCRKLIGKPVSPKKPRPRWSELIEALTGLGPFTCPHCCRGKLKLMRQIDPLHLRLKEACRSRA